MAHFSKNVPQPFVKLLNISNFKIPFFALSDPPVSDHGGLDDLPERGLLRR